MPAKILKFEEDARSQLLSGVAETGESRESHARPARPECRH